jgi:flagellar hook-associated protein 1 FlgK
MSLLSVARDALAAQSAGTDITGQNVANVNTPGFVRRNAILQTRAIPGAPGGGVEFKSSQRAFDRFAQARVVSEDGKRSSADARSTALTELESTLSPGTNGISERLASFFSSMSAFAQDPTNATARAAAVTATDDLAHSVSGAAGSIVSQRSALLQRAAAAAGEVNERLGRIAALNRQIATAQAGGQDANDLRDQRDLLVNEVGQRIDVKAIEDPSGALTLLSSGSTLVTGALASSISIGVDPPGNMKIQIMRPNGSAIDVTSRVTSGAIGGLREARDVDLPNAAKALDQLAFDVSSTVNALHVTGFGLDGVSGRPLFVPPAGVAGAAAGMAIDPAILASPDKLAAASSAGNLPSGNDVAIALAQLSQAALPSGKTPADTFAALAGDVGVAKVQATSELDLRSATLAQATSARDSVSGVTIDEEMVNLTRYQRAFEANMNVLKTANDLLDQIVKEL